MSVLRKSTLALSLAAIVSSHAFAAASTHEQLTQLAQDIVHTTAKLEPMQATYLGIAGADGELEIPSEAARAADVARLRAWSARIDAVSKAAGASMSLVDRDDATLLRAQVDISWWVIRGLERLGLVWNVHVPDEAQLARRQKPAHAPAGA